MSAFATFDNFTAPTHGIPTEATYYAQKLKRAGRPWKLISAFLLLFFAVQRRQRTLIPECLALASAISAYVAGQLGVQAPDPRPIARALQTRINEYVDKADGELLPGLLPARIALIVVSETQLATVRTVREAAAHLEHIRRETTSPNPCDECAQLEGEYTAPFPDAIWWVHPRCACTYSHT